MSETNPFPTDLDQNQIFQRAFNQDTDRIRVDAELSASIIPTPGLEVSISSVDDNIAIRNSNNSNELLIEADGSINVNATFAGTIGTVDQGNPNTIANAWPVKITDGTDTVAINADGSLNIGNFPATVAVTQSTSPWVISGTVIANAGTGTFDVNVTNATLAVTQNTSPWVISGTVAATQSGTWNINDISGTISLPTGASTSANQTNGSQKTQIVDGSGNVIASTSNALNVNVNNTVPISGTITVNQGTSPWVVGQSTAANLNATVVGTGTFAVQAAQSGNWSTRTQDGSGNAITSTGNALDVNLKTSSITLNVSATQSGTWTVQPGNTANTTPWLVSTKTALTASSPTAATVGVASAQAVASNSSRKGLVLTNTSVNTISFGLGATAVLNSGITLYPGGTWQMDETTFTTSAINAIASVASSNLAIQEYT